MGDVRRYDTRAARRPVTNWTGIGKVGGIGVVEKGHTEKSVELSCSAFIICGSSLYSELFVADKGCNLFSLDLRNGKVCYGYKGMSPFPWFIDEIITNTYFHPVIGLAAAVTSISPSMSLLASGAHDRFVRLHSTFPPPTQVGQQQEDKGQVLDNFYLKVVPTVIVADIGQETQDAELSLEEDEVDPDDVWDQLEVVEHEDDIQKANTKKTKKRKALA